MDPVWGAQLRSPAADRGNPDLRRLQVTGVGIGQASRSSHSARYHTAGHPQPHLQTSTCTWVTADNSSCSGAEGLEAEVPQWPQTLALNAISRTGSGLAGETAESTTQGAGVAQRPDCARATWTGDARGYGETCSCLEQSGSPRNLLRSLDILKSPLVAKAFRLRDSGPFRPSLPADPTWRLHNRSE